MKYVISNNISVKDELTAAGSKSLAGYIPIFDAEVIKRLDSAGFKRVGHAETSEFGTDMSALAKLVADGSADFAIGSDTAGEIVYAAEKFGLFGLRPSYGAVSRDGLIPYASGMDTVGIIAKDIATLKKVFSTVATNIKTMPANSNDAISDVFLFSAELVRAVHLIISSAELASNLSRIDGIRYGYRAPEFKDTNEMIEKTRGEGFSYEIKKRILLGNFVLLEKNLDKYFKKAQDLCAGITASARKNKTSDILTAVLAGLPVLTSPNGKISVGKFAKDSELFERN